MKGFFSKVIGPYPMCAEYGFNETIVHHACRVRLSEKSNIPQRESKIRFWHSIGVRGISVSRGLFGRPGGGVKHREVLE